MADADGGTATATMMILILRRMIALDDYLHDDMESGCDVGSWLTGMNEYKDNDDQDNNDKHDTYFSAALHDMHLFLFS